MHPNPAQGVTVERTATLGHAVADRNVTYVADTRAIYDHKVHLVREDLGTDGTDRLKRYAEAISASRSHAASARYRGDPPCDGLPRTLTAQARDRGCR
jgi:hypothetical protein